jgi:hypothetical protein
MYLAEVNEPNKERPHCSERARRCIDGEERKLLVFAGHHSRASEKEENEHTQTSTIEKEREERIE